MSGTDTINSVIRELEDACRWREYYRALQASHRTYSAQLTRMEEIVTEARANLMRAIDERYEAGYVAAKAEIAARLVEQGASGSIRV